MLIEELEANTNEANIAGMARFGISCSKAYGISIPDLRAMAKPFRKNHGLAKLLIHSGSHEGRILAGFIGDSSKVTPEEMDEWVLLLENWADCDGLCGDIWTGSGNAVQKANEWSLRPEEVVKRAAFSLMARLAVHDKSAPDPVFLDFLPIIAREAHDERNLVKKAVNWALRQIGKRNETLLHAAIECGEEIQKQGSKAARWIASDALRELRGKEVKLTLKGKK